MPALNRLLRQAISEALHLKGNSNSYASPGRNRQGDRGIGARDGNRKARAGAGDLTSTSWKRSSARRSSTTASGPTAASSTKSARSPSKSACCPEPMVPPCSREVKPRPWSRRHWELRTTNSAWKPSKGNRSSASCCTTISRRSASARSSRCAAPAGAKSATAPWRSAACCR